MTSFFPELLFGWLFYGVLVSFTLLACYADLRWVVIPKWITIPAFALGVVFNVIRGAWLGYLGEACWKFGKNGPWIGALDGLVFSIAGFAVGFGLTFVLWMVGGCRGGDVKLFSAVATWVGPFHALVLLIGANLVAATFAVIDMFRRIMKDGIFAVRLKKAAKKPKEGAIVSRWMAYSPPLAIATSLLMLWFYRVDLRLAEPRQARVVQTAEGGQIP